MLGFQSNVSTYGAWSPEPPLVLCPLVKGQNIKSHHNQAGYIPAGTGARELIRCQYTPSRMIERTGGEV